MVMPCVYIKIKVSLCAWKRMIIVNITGLATPVSSGSPSYWNLVAISTVFLWLMLHSEVDWILSSRKKGYSVQTLVAKVDYIVAIG